MLLDPKTQKPLYRNTEECYGIFNAIARANDMNMCDTSLMTLADAALGQLQIDGDYPIPGGGNTSGQVPAYCAGMQAMSCTTGKKPEWKFEYPFQP